MWQAIIPIIGTVIDKVLPDPAVAAEAKLRALELAQRGELATLDADVRLALGQMDINRVEAGTDKFRGGWRPAAGWVCVFGLGYSFLLRPLLPWAVQVAGGPDLALPAIDTMELLVLLGGMLGLGGYRTAEKLRSRG